MVTRTYTITEKDFPSACTDAIELIRMNLCFDQASFLILKLPAFPRLPAPFISWGAARLTAGTGSLTRGWLRPKALRNSAWF